MKESTKEKWKTRRTFFKRELTFFSFACHQHFFLLVLKRLSFQLDEKM